MVCCQFRFGEFGLQGPLYLRVARCSETGRNCMFLRICLSAGSGRRNWLIQARNGGQKQQWKERHFHRDRLLFFRGERYCTFFRG